jgi:sporulation protein YlmC with PRC-barrel domain
MLMISEDQIRDIIGSALYASDGEKVGKIDQLYLDDATGRPDFATVAMGFLGGRESFVPLSDATFTDEGISVPFSAEKIKEAPNVEVEGAGHLSVEQEATLYRYYGLTYAEATSDAEGAGFDTEGSPEAVRARLRRYFRTPEPGGRGEAERPPN